MTTRPAPTMVLVLFDRFARSFRIRTGLPSAVERAHQANADLSRIDPATCRDTGLSPEEATGHSRHQPDLPFFMQAGFRARD